ncbi:MAG: EAL domain-containing protein [Pseudohongiellaceae bacterium]
MAQRSLTTHLTGLIWLAVLPMVALGTWAAYDRVRTQGQEIREEGRLLARNAANALDNYLDARIRALSVLAASPLADTPEDWPQLYAEAQAVRDNFGTHVVFSDLGNPMRMRFNTRAPYGTELPPIPVPTGAAAAPRALETGRPAVGDSFTGPLANEMLVAIAVPGIRNDQVSHLVLATLEASQLQQPLDSLALPDGWALTLTDSRGEPLAVRGAQENTLPDQEAAAEEQFRVRSRLSPWQVTLTIPESELSGPGVMLAMNSALLIIVATLTGLIGGVYASRRLNRQLACLADPVPSTAPPSIREIAAVRHLLDQRAKQLLDSEAEFRTLIETMPQIVWVTLPDGWHLQFNQHWFDFTGLTLHESLGQGWNPAFHPDDQERAAKRWQEAITTGEPYEIEYRLRRADGVYRWMLGRALPLRDSSGRIVKWFGTCTDIHDLKQTERTLATRAHQQVLVAGFGRSVLATADIVRACHEAATIMADGLGVGHSKVLLYDEPSRTCTITAGVGWSPEWIGRKIHRSDWSYSQTDHVLDSQEAVIIENFRHETRFSPSPLLVQHNIISGINVVIQGVEGPLGILGAYAREPRHFSTDDVGFLQSLANTLGTAIERQRTDERITHMAHHDALTNLPNRFLLADRLGVALAEARRHGWHLAVMFLDLDRFKNANDVYGHAFGDRILQEVADRLTASLRAMDTVSRQGGDEFVVLLPALRNDQEAQQVAQKLLATFVPPFQVDGTEVVLSGSIGIACFPTNGEDTETLLRNADAAMYVAKENGRNRYQLYAADMHARTIEHLMLEGDLRRAVEKDQLYLEYQPQLDLATGGLIGIEALVRWQHPEHGLISPARFIPIAEESGQIVAIGTWILEKACRQHARWIAEGLEVGTIAVNVSAYQFGQPDFDRVVDAVLKRTGLGAERLELELTESVVMQGTNLALDKLDRLHALGVRLAIDDFGTGYSSLSYLKQFPLYRLKIDQSFTAGLPEDRESLAIAEAIIHLGHSLGLDVLAEGIETADQQDQLRALGCNAGQGYLYAEPLAADDVREFALARKNDVTRTSSSPVPPGE